MMQKTRAVHTHGHHRSAAYRRDDSKMCDMGSLQKQLNAFQEQGYVSFVRA
jgi:hypothetical protein